MHGTFLNYVFWPSLVEKDFAEGWKRAQRLLLVFLSSGCCGTQTLVYPITNVMENIRITVGYVSDQKSQPAEGLLPHWFL